MNSSESLTNIGPALLAAQKEIEHAPKKATGQVGKMEYKYADLEAVLDATEPVLNKHGIILLQLAKDTNGGATIISTLLHATSGEWISDGGFHCPTTGNGAQGVGAAATYARRYGLAALLGIAQQDDDGAAASTPPAAAAQAAPARTNVTRPAPRANTAPLGKRIKALPEKYRNRIRDDIATAGITWSSMTPDQVKVVDGIVHEAENDANAEAAA